ncbi:MAG: LemA family protein [Deltaproteobacteria bacterium]|nr:LemA family protein [Deltaproteobacteria bacterium]NIS76508.1 LemA family protein [Deltaproteobacteria bacterium]
MHYVPLVLIAAGVGWGILTYNAFVSMKNRIRNSFHQIDVQLRRKIDLIPNLVEVVKDYMSFEKDTLERVIQARSMVTRAKDPKEKAESSALLTDALKSLFAVVESYPDLKANRAVADLEEELTSTENRIAYSRQFYNDCVMAYNTKLEKFPSNLIGSLFNYEKEIYFDTGGEREQRIRVDLVPGN